VPFHDRYDCLDSRTICPITGKRKPWFPVYKGKAKKESYHSWNLHFLDKSDRKIIFEYWNQRKKREDKFRSHFSESLMKALAKRNR
jgi:hypothetical protein